MIYPSIGELTNNYKINRYTLVVATAKCARIITDEYTKQREYAEKLIASKDAEKGKNIASMIKREYRDEKAVKTAITGLYAGEFKIIEPDGTVEMLGGHTPEEFEDLDTEETFNECADAGENEDTDEKTEATEEVETVGEDTADEATSESAE